jgi:hypothetical protein
MHTARKPSGTASLLLAVALVSLSTAAMAQNAPPPADPNAPPPGYQDPNAAPPAGYAPPPGAYTPPPAYTAPPGYPPTAYAAPPPANLHDGFYLRLHLGGGFTNLSASQAGTDVTISGGSETFGAAFGGVVSPNLIIYGSLFGSSMTDPAVDVSGTSLTSSGTVNLIGVGPGLAYYFEPVNMYVAGTLAAMKVTTSDSSGNNSADGTKWGFGLQAMVGKEWWVTQDWGLGVAGEVLFASMKDSADSTITWTGTAFSVAFSATYN